MQAKQNEINSTNKLTDQDSRIKIITGKGRRKPYKRRSVKGIKINKNDVHKRLNGLGRYIESNEHWSYQKVADHLGVKKQSIWVESHRPYGIENLTLGKLYDLSKVFNEELTDFIDQLIKLEKN